MKVSTAPIGQMTTDAAAAARKAILTFGAVTLAAAFGIATVYVPSLVVVFGGAVAVIGIAILDLHRVERILTLTLLFGGFVLGYGFANLGVRAGGVPIPATEMLAIPLILVALTVPTTRPPARVLLPVSLFSLLVVSRAFIDYPRWGIFAVRDATIGIEALIIVIGYRAALRDGVERWIGRFKLVMLAVLVYGGLLYPWESQLSAMGPTVGLQQPVPFLDPRGSKFAVIAAALYFLAFSRGWRRLVVVGTVAGLVGVFQARTLYLLFPLGIMFLGWLNREQLRTILRLVPVIAAGVVLVMALSTLSIEGRRGPVDPAFITAHARTLLGEEGPMSGSIRGRVDWFQRTMDAVTASPTSTILGLGLGPDLTFGMLVGNQGQAVRKPHDDYLEVFARLGLVGLGIFIWMLLACLAPIIRRARSGDGIEARFCGWIAASCFVYLGVAGAQPLLSFPYGSIPLFFMLGIGVGAARKVKNPEGEPLL